MEFFPVKIFSKKFKKFQKSCNKMRGSSAIHTKGKKYPRGKGKGGNG